MRYECQSAENIFEYLKNSLKLLRLLRYIYQRIVG